MSKIQTELQDIAEVDPKRGESRQDFLMRMTVEVNRLPDSAWNKLSKEAQNWANEASDAANAKKTIPDFPDMDPPAEASSGRRRTAAADDAPYEPKVKDDVKITTKRGKVVTGKIVEMDKEVIVLKNTEGAEEEVSRDRVEKIEPLASGGGSGRSADKEDPGPRDPAKGDTLTITTKRGKVATGECVEITDEFIVIKVNGEETEFDKDRIESVKIEGGQRRAAESSGTSRRSADDSKDKDGGGKDAKTEDGGRTRSTNAGVSVGQRIRELIIEDMSAKVEDIGKALKKEGLEFRDNTLSLNYNEAHKFLELLDKKGKLKK